MARTKYFTISIATSRRRASYRAPDPALGLDWAFFDACTDLSPHLVHDAAETLAVWGKPLTRSEIGCYSSHYELWRRLATEGDADQYVILEDDCLVDWDYVASLTRRDWAAEGSPYLRLCSKIPCDFRVIRRAWPDLYHHLIEYTDLCVGAQGYVIAREAAKTFTAAMRRLDRPVDVAMDRAWAHGVRNRAVFPHPVMELALPSDIGEARFDPARPPARFQVNRAVEKARRLLWKVTGRF